MGGSLEGVFLYWFTSKGNTTYITCLSTKDIPVRIVIIPKARKGGGLLDLQKIFSKKDSSESILMNFKKFIAPFHLNYFYKTKVSRGTCLKKSVTDSLVRNDVGLLHFFLSTCPGSPRQTIPRAYPVKLRSLICICIRRDPCAL